MCGGGGGGGTLFSCIRRLWLFLGLKILNSNLFIFLGGGGGGGGSDDFVNIFFWGGGGGVITNWTILSFLCILGSFQKVNVPDGEYFLGC